MGVLAAAEKELRMRGVYVVRSYPISLAVFLLASSFAQAAPKATQAPAVDCSEVRLDAKGGTMEHVPVVDQGDFSFCFAAVSAERDDAYRISHGGDPHFHASMIEAAIGNEYSGRGGSIMHAVEGGGGQCDVADYFKKKGTCSQGVFDRSDNTLSADMAFLAKSYDIQDEDKNQDQPDSCGKPKKRHDTFSEAKELLESQACKEAEAIKSQLAQTKNDLMDVLSSVSQRAEARVLAQLPDACTAAGRASSGFSSCEDTFVLPGQMKYTKRVISRYLSSKHVQPFEISYCSTVLTAGKNYVGLNDRAEKPEDFQKCDCGSHASLVIGKRPNPKTGKCEFLIQNSWGTDCSAYSKDWKCDHGKIWVNADVLSKNIQTYSYLK
jgi:hypothetical protein